MGALDRVCRPASVQGVRGHDAAEIAEAGDEGGGSGHAHFAVAVLEDLVGPGHADGDGWAEPEANEEEAAVACPWTGGGRESDD